MREVAGYDFDRCLTVATWPLVELLHAYYKRVKDNAHRGYMHRVLVWASQWADLKDKKAPDVPAILKDEG